MSLQDFNNPIEIVKRLSLCIDSEKDVFHKSTVLTNTIIKEIL
ncbi:MAG: hypothetical protein A4E57_00016 [Syntrophorhabdaceae bacterium PtaU1.Bin034]|nr:MAG: hypothetical protein A4E57_00016 [Syntrophorhabdaceae bacterium PtaU1.Bin034]